MLALAKAFEASNRPQDLYRTYQRLVKTFPDYPELPAIYRKLISLAETFGTHAEKEHYQSELDRFSP